MKIIIFGCGQGGAAAATWLGPNSELIAFADNDNLKQNTYSGKIPVVSPEQAVKMQPDDILISVLNAGAVHEIVLQLRALGYEGNIKSVIELKRLFDLRLAVSRLLADELNSRGINGAVAELGVYRGEFAAALNALFPDRELYLFDTFEGFSEAEVVADRANGYLNSKVHDFCDTNAEYVMSKMPHPEKVRLFKGLFPATLPKDMPEFCFVSLDPDLYEPARAGLDVFWPKLVRGGVIVIHDYNSTQYLGIKRAVSEFCVREAVIPVPLPDLHGSAVLVK